MRRKNFQLFEKALILKTDNFLLSARLYDVAVFPVIDFLACLYKD